MLWELPSAGCSQPGPCLCSPLPAGIWDAPTAALPPRLILLCRELRFPVLPSHPGEEEREWVDGARGAAGYGAGSLLQPHKPPGISHWSGKSWMLQAHSHLSR